MSDEARGSSDVPEPQLMGPVWHRFLSPHYDDIALSCGGTAALLADLGWAPEVAILFGAEPDPHHPFSSYAATMHQEWGLDSSEVIACRRREERAAAAVLGTTMRILPFRDAIYRGHYLSDDALFGPPAPAEAGLPVEIANALTDRADPEPDVRFYAPLAIGGHVDHRHGFAAGRELARLGWEVWFYEDHIYCLRPGSVEERLGELTAAGTPLAVTATFDVGSLWEDKLAAILAYPSQLANVFRYIDCGPARDEIDAAYRRHAAKTSNGRLIERFWRLAGR